MHTNSENFRLRFEHLLGEVPSGYVDGVCLALDALLERKSSLIEELSEDPRVQHRPNGGLGAICISCVESHVTPILKNYGIATDMIARQYPYKWCERFGFPPIHAYNLLNLGPARFVLDLDADPFYGANTGVVVAPLAAKLPIYELGFAYHKRSCASNGEIVEFSCMHFDDKHGQRVYMDGDVAEHFSIVPYHFESGANRCPIVIAGGATLYFGYDKCSDRSGNVFHSVSLSCVCAVPASTAVVYNLHFHGIRSFHVRRADASSTAISIAFDSRSRFELLIAPDGTVLPNTYVNLHRSSETMPQTVSVRVAGNNDLPVKLELPFWEQANHMTPKV